VTVELAAHERPGEGAGPGLVVGGTAVLVGFGLESLGLGGDDYLVPLVILGVAAAVFFSALIALDVDAVRDLEPERRTNTRLDFLRIPRCLPPDLLCPLPPCCPPRLQWMCRARPRRSALRRFRP